jgi:hypothetical protein
MSAKCEKEKCTVMVILNLICLGRTNENYKSVININYFLSQIHETTHLIHVHCFSTFHVIAITTDVLSVFILGVATLFNVLYLTVLRFTSLYFTTATVCVIIIHFNVLHCAPHSHIPSLIISVVSSLCLFPL